MRIMGQSRCTWMWAKNEVHDLSSPSSLLQTLASRSAAMNSWEEQAFAEDVSRSLVGGCVWPPRSYSCSFCRRDFRSAQALGGHMNVHRRDRAALLKQQSPPTEVVPQQIHASKPCTSFDGTTPSSRVSTTLWYINPNPELSSDAGLLVLSPSSHVTRVSSSPSPPKKVNNYEQERVFFSPVVDSDDHEILDSIKNRQEKKSKNSRANKQDLLTDKDLSRDLNLAVCRRKKRHTSSDEEVTSNCKRRRLMMDAKPNLSFFPKLISTINDRRDLPRSETMFEVLMIKSGSVEGELDLELRLGGALT